MKSVLLIPFYVSGKSICRPSLKKLNFIIKLKWYCTLKNGNEILYRSSSLKQGLHVCLQYRNKDRCSSVKFLVTHFPLENERSDKALIINPPDVVFLYVIKQHLQKTVLLYCSLFHGVDSDVVR